MIALETIAKGDSSHVADARRTVARTEDEWQTLWAIHAGPAAAVPEIDFTTAVVAAAFAGEKPSAGHSVEITAADGPGPGVRLIVEERVPSRDTIAAAIITSPFHIVKVPRAAGDVEWDRPESETTVRAIPKETAIPKPPASARSTSSTGLAPTTAAALAYLAGPFSGVLILLAESSNPDVRFHAWQSIVGLGGLGLAVIVSYVLAFAAMFVSATGVSLMVAVATVIWIVLLIVWVLCLWKALAGGRWKLPLAGDYAARFADR
jgi:uncharacterized membrane protein